jgi:hypothetical protein
VPGARPLNPPLIYAENNERCSAMIVIGISLRNIFLFIVYGLTSLSTIFQLYIRRSKSKDRQHNDKKENKTSNDLNTAQITKD